MELASLLRHGGEDGLTWEGNAGGGFGGTQAVGEKRGEEGWLAPPHSSLGWRDRVHPCDVKWLYLTFVIDLCSRRVVGWALTDHMRSGFVIEAMRQAIAK